MSLVLTALFLTFIAFWAGIFWAEAFRRHSLLGHQKATALGVAFQITLFALTYVLPLFAIVLQDGDASGEVNRAALAILLNCVVLPTILLIPSRLPEKARRMMFEAAENRP